MGSMCLKFLDHRLNIGSVIVQKPFFQLAMPNDLDLLTLASNPKVQMYILGTWGASVCSFMIIGGIQSQL